METGIFKSPVNEAIFLGKEAIKGDTVVDRKYHGGLDKACYFYSADWYPFWKEKYPDLKWQYGMFGENITLKDMDENQLHIGDTFELGGAKVQISSARQPCYKLGVKFGNQGIIKEFIKSPYPGFYVRVLQEGTVDIGEEMKLIERPKDSISLIEYWSDFYDPKRSLESVERILTNPYFSEDEKDSLRRKVNGKT